MTVAMGVLGWDYAVADHDEGLEDNDKSRDARERRSKGLEKFILALSDQQLVTGLAVLIAGYISPCSMSIYHFNIVAALGWFSSTTHLSTLAVLRVYFIEHPRLRNCRVVAMLFVFALLIVAQGVTVASRLDNSVPVRCAWTHNSSSHVTFLDLISMIAIIIFLCVTYSSRIVRMYSLDPEWSLQVWFADGVVKAFRKRARLSNLTEIAIVCSKLPQVEQDNIRRKVKERQQYLGQELVKIVIKSSSKSKVEQGVLWQSLNERRRYTGHFNVMKPKRSSPDTVLTSEIGHSFLSDRFTLEFGIALGITQVIFSRTGESSAGIVGSQDNVNFGQLVPLLLMLLPLFAAGEVYSGNNDNLYAWGLILIVPSLERREDMLTKFSNNKIRPPKQTHGKPFFSRKIGLADIFKLSHSTQSISDNTSQTGDVYSSLELLGSILFVVGGSIRNKFQTLPTNRLRRPDTETGQRALMTGHCESTRTSSRNPVPENGDKPAKPPKKPRIPWRAFTVVVAGYITLLTILAIIFGSHTGSLSPPVDSVVKTYLGATLIVILIPILYNIYQGLKESRNPWCG